LVMGGGKGVPQIKTKNNIALKRRSYSGAGEKGFGAPGPKQAQFIAGLASG